MNRRRFLSFSTTALGGIFLPTRTLFADESTELLPLTNAQIEGPFYPLTPSNSSTVIPESPPDCDLVSITTDDGILPDAGGQILHFNGQLLNRQGCAIPGAIVELWNTDGNGWYIDPQSGSPDDTGPRDVNFQGFGSTTTSEHGAFSFRTIRPVPYPFVPGRFRASHLHLKAKVDGITMLTTQLYFSDELNTWIPDDTIHGLLPDPNDLTRIQPNLITTNETLDAEGNTVLTGHLNIVIDSPSNSPATFTPEISNYSLNRSDNRIHFKITPGRLVDVQTSIDLANWTPIATNQSALFGLHFSSGLPQRIFFRTVDVNGLV